SLENYPDLKMQILQSIIHRLSSKKQGPFIIDAFQIIDKLNHLFPNIEFQLIGGNEVLVYESEKKKTSIFIAVLVWLILFIGTAMTIVNFHYDVNMQEVQKKLH